MLFNSYAFLFLFLPVTFLGFFQIGRYSRPLAALWLFAASLFFYGWWNPAYVGLLLASIFFNYTVGMALSREHTNGHVKRKKWILGLGITADLGLLGYYKYTNFFVESANTALNLGWHIDPIILPLGISFFTFTQIAFLVDAYRGEVKEANFIHYGLFVTYFPHLIAVPVLHHKEMMPQFGLPATYRIDWENLSVGMSIFSIGLFKKVVLADGIAPFASPVFAAAAANGDTLTFLEAWGGALSYTFQLYFDFSGYSDMAIGISRLFGVKLPLNFNSTYKAVNIIEFWRRWHMTLSRFLRDYLYFALGGNRKGPARRYLNLMATMLLGGLWHGAGWTFVMWGILHGLYLVINHAWHQVRKALGHDLKHSTLLGHFASMTLTFVVVIGWVFFRAESFDAAISILRGMTGLNGFILPDSWYGLFHWRLLQFMDSLGIHIGSLPVFDNFEGVWIIALWVLAWVTPNTQQIMSAFKPALEEISYPAHYFSWKPSKAFAWLIGFVFVASLFSMNRVSEFLYFQF